MTVYRCLPLFREHTGEMNGVLQQQGTLVTDSAGSHVRTSEGLMSDVIGWRPTPSEAWECCGLQIDHIADKLRLQATACRTRATEEACS
jgi:hypothetical protein